ncbi:hypothetical protein M407DRAFT_27686 [Tulasnella calospora MUT 4182]|uniref:Uncharacterized protein n=1 Tax=Tulasnella calospora MUT 4182 TaxID=1051891 RepID=A0A0C3QC19_9AGAM|nr:hypothetical protein M407DRAFT_27686 [Tulasnella calospora MUT 4182]
MYFVDEMKKFLNEDDVGCFSHQFIRLSQDGRYGYLAGVSVFTQYGEGSGISSTDARIQDLANALGLWSFFYEPGSTSQTNGPEES